MRRVGCLGSTDDACSQFPWRPRGKVAQHEKDDLAPFPQGLRNMTVQVDP